MALFGKTDSNLPYLTRFYQVNDPDDELFFDEDGKQISVDGFNFETIEQTEMFAFLRQDWLTNVAGAGGIPDNYFCGDDVFDEYYQLHKLIRPLMDGLADDDLVPVSHLVDLLRILERTKKYTFAIETEPPSGYSGDVFVEDIGSFGINDSMPARALQLVEVDRQDEHAMSKLLYEVQGLLTWPLTNVLRCRECKNPFIVQRVDQQFCSHRCASRASARNRRQNANPIQRQPGRPKKVAQTV